MYTVRCTLYTVQCTICNTNTKNGMSILMLGVILKRRPQGGGRGGQGKRDMCGHRGGGLSKGGRPQKNFEES